jgi:hypothetical protein
MKIHDFGLWFKETASGKWSVTIPTCPHYFIYYDGRKLGKQWADFDLTICDDEPHIIKLKKKLTQSMAGFYEIGRRLSLDDFEIVKNPDYRGDQ